MACARERDVEISGAGTGWRRSLAEAGIAFYNLRSSTIEGAMAVTTTRSSEPGAPTVSRPGEAAHRLAPVAMHCRRHMPALLVAAAASASACAANVPASLPVPKTPIHHLIVVFQENVSFDHYFATYPWVQNDEGENTFRAAPDTPSVNGLTAALLEHNPNAAQPFLLGRGARRHLRHGPRIRRRADARSTAARWTGSWSTPRAKSPGASGAW